MARILSIDYGKKRTGLAVSDPLQLIAGGLATVATSDLFEYLQQYVYEHNALDKNGKFANDFRVSGWGKLLRKYWLDELPMVWNILKGDMKLIGVRPLSEQYYSLYTPEMQQYRILCKPGLLPPYYADMPEGIEEVQQSEKKYLDVFFQNPFRTQWVYFWKIMCSIFIKRHHSQ